MGIKMRFLVQSPSRALVRGSEVLILWHFLVFRTPSKHFRFEIVCFGYSKRKRVVGIIPIDVVGK